MIATSVTFSILPIWVQLWGLPFDLINEEAGWEIGKGLGYVVEVDNKTFISDQARFIRIRVELPLKNHFGEGDGLQILRVIRYELVSSMKG